MERTLVTSSNIASIGYDAAALILEIQFATGRTYQYLEVEPGVYPLLLKADSIGKAFQRYVRGQYEAREVTPDANQFAQDTLDEGLQT